MDIARVGTEKKFDFLVIKCFLGFSYFYLVPSILRLPSSFLWNSIVPGFVFPYQYVIPSYKESPRDIKDIQEESISHCHRYLSLQIDIQFAYILDVPGSLSIIASVKFNRIQLWLSYQKLVYYVVALFISLEDFCGKRDDGHNIPREII